MSLQSQTKNTSGEKPDKLNKRKRLFSKYTSLLRLRDDRAAATSWHGGEDSSAPVRVNRVPPSAVRAPAGGRRRDLSTLDRINRR